MMRSAIGLRPRNLNHIGPSVSISPLSPPSPTPPTPPTSATMDDRSPPPPTPPLSEETKEKKAKRQRRETSERWHSEHRRQSRLSCAGCLTREGPKQHCQRCGDLYCRECVNLDTALCYLSDGPFPQSIDAEGTTSEVRARMDDVAYVGVSGSSLERPRPQQPSWSRSRRPRTNLSRDMAKGFGRKHPA